MYIIDVESVWFFCRLTRCIFSAVLEISPWCVLVGCLSKFAGLRSMSCMGVDCCKWMSSLKGKRKKEEERKRGRSRREEKSVEERRTTRKSREGAIGSQPSSLSISLFLWLIGLPNPPSPRLQEARPQSFPYSFILSPFSLLCKGIRGVGNNQNYPFIPPLSP